MVAVADQVHGMTPLWLDCDPGRELTGAGHDDAFAILLAVHHPALKLLGVSTVHGNASLDHTTANAGSVLTAIGASNIPYYPGAAKPFCRAAAHAPDIHGESGLDGTELLPKASGPPRNDTSAILAMRESLMSQRPATPWLVATGALTNIAILFAAFPEVVEHIQGLSIMGGAIGGGFTSAPMGRIHGEGERFGNQTPWAEFNIYCDPEAAEAIFSNPRVASKTTLITLDLSHQVLANKSVQQTLVSGPVLEKNNRSAVRLLFIDLLLYFAHTYENIFGLKEGPPLHDPLAVAVVLFDILAEPLAFDDRLGERWNVKVVTDGLHSDNEDERGRVGQTRISRAAGDGVRIPRGLDVARFWEVVEQCLRRAEKSPTDFR